ncbi:MAG TPA: histidine kinase dimerization/phospho-acceptor domain-containing protein, partial [Thermoanaerobaculia bacterium]|nr:histidine kinase dimerization/phospho-acceptor domain-containing protein [Thermoanaerobaculia bacterium]
MRRPFRSMRFRTKLAFAVLLLFVATVALLFAVDTYNERKLVDKLENTMEAVTKAIEVASDQAQISASGEIDNDVLQDYAEKLRQRGVREIQILSPERAVIASSKGKPRRRAAPEDIAIKGTIGGDVESAGPKRDYRLIMPIISQNQKVGYVRVDLLLDDYEATISRSFGRRVAALTVVFAVGLVLLLLLTRNFTQPVGQLTAAAQRLAEGDLDASIDSRRSDDLGVLVQTWNAMVARLKEQRALEARLAAAERRASLGHLASGIAHEIRNPLNTIALAVEYLRRRFLPAGDADRREFEQTAESLRDEIARLNALITNFLSYGKPMRLSPAAFDATELARDVARALAPEAALRNVEIGVDGPPAEITADRDLLKAAFLNVALNAVQMVPAGGRLRIVA